MYESPIGANQFTPVLERSLKLLMTEIYKGSVIYNSGYRGGLELGRV